MHALAGILAGGGNGSTLPGAGTLEESISCIPANSVLSLDFPAIVGALTPPRPLLHIRSTLADLTLHAAPVQPDQPISAIAAQLSELPHLPGLMLPGLPTRVISRAALFEAACSPMAASVSLTQSALAKPALQLSETTPILTAAQQLLRQPTPQQQLPVVVTTAQGDRLLSPTELNTAYWHLRGIETQIRYERFQLEQLQMDKLADLGRLVDGVAHEILDPVSFIWGNLSHIGSYCDQLLDLIAQYEAELPQPSPALQTARDSADLDYLRADLPAAVRSVRSGANRLRQLAISLQNFCHMDEVYPKPADLHSLLDSLLLLLQTRIETPLQIERQYGKLPPVPCFAGQLGQVLMTVLINAVDALLADQADAAAPPKLTVTTQVCSRLLPASECPTRWVQIIVKDNGPGLLPVVEQEIATACSTQTRLIKETSLARSYRIVTANHGGRFQVRSCQFTQPHSRTKAGTEFEILLPLTKPE